MYGRFADVPPRQHLRVVPRQAGDQALGDAVGDPQDERSDIGALCTRDQFARVLGFLEDGLDNGATARAVGLPPDVRRPR